MIHQNWLNSSKTVQNAQKEHQTSEQNTKPTQLSYREESPGIKSGFSSIKKKVQRKYLVFFLKKPDQSKSVPVTALPDGSGKVLQEVAVPEALTQRESVPDIQTPPETTVQDVASANEEKGSKLTSILNSLQDKLSNVDTSQAAVSDSGFDHFNVGFQLTGAHINVECAMCHVKGVFKGTPNQCDQCHSNSGQVVGTAKPTSHIQTVAQCDDCHSTAGWTPANISHISITGTCSSCHNGTTATGKSANHIASNSSCDSCHFTSGWVPANMDHSSVTGTCVSCHNGSSVIGKSSSHIQSSNTCDDCHTTNNFTSATFDHGSVTATCFSCHNGKNSAYIALLPVKTTCPICHNRAAIPVMIVIRQMAGYRPIWIIHRQPVLVLAVIMVLVPLQVKIVLIFQVLTLVMIVIRRATSQQPLLIMVQ